MKDLVCKGCSYPTLRCGLCGTECCEHFAESVRVERDRKTAAVCHPCLTDPDDLIEAFRPTAAPSEDCYP